MLIVIKSTKAKLWIAVMRSEAKTALRRILFKMGKIMNYSFFSPLPILSG